MSPLSPRILFIDSYDWVECPISLAHLVRLTITGCQVHLITNDSIPFEQLLPAIPSDVGLIPQLWTLPEEHLLPIFGVCLGFQSLGLALGGRLRTMRVVKHGMISHVEHTGCNIFQGLSADIKATRYHSLCIDVDAGRTHPDFEPLAWADDGLENGKVLMAARHRTKPFWGVQYHPESICTDGGGGEVIQNFWRLALEWMESKQRATPGQALSPLMPDFLRQTWPQTRSIPKRLEPRHNWSVSYTTLKYPNMPIPQVCEMLGVDAVDSHFVLLDAPAKSGRWAIMGALKSDTLSVRYTLPDDHLIVQHGDQNPTHEVLPSGMSIWAWLSNTMSERILLRPGHSNVPFWGGFIGYLSYELGVAELGIPLKHRSRGKDRHPDVNLVFVERSIVFDKDLDCAYIQSLIPEDQCWLQEMRTRLEEMRDRIVHPPDDVQALSSRISYSSKEVYVPKVEECQYHLSVGSSYELCLTAQSKLYIPCSAHLSSWRLYKRLRSSNPAPHAAYFRLGPTTLLGSSPERFLRWDRSGHCELRPIKGTLRKVIIDEEGKKHYMQREDADELLGRNVKERAENLMIVDLVRHDLGGVISAADGVQVEKLMVIEEYETVWQMVSVISGTVRVDGGGWEVLRRSLPPGSMTGAPKKRSVELLQHLEGEERGVYSGVCGYWCVGGGGDWAVIIRSCFRYHATRRDARANNEDDGEEEWTLGAGGAITALSDPTAEWEEMCVKLSSVGRAFGAAI